MGNSPLKETELLGLALARLTSALPETWRVEATREPALAVGRQKLRPDAILDLTATDGASASFVMEVKRSGRLSVGALIDQMNQYVAIAGRPGVVVTDYANPALRAACLNHGFGYIDHTGWMYLRCDRPALLISQQGAAKAPGLVQGGSAMTRLSGPGASQVIQTLFDVPLPIGVRDLAEAAGVSPGTVAKVLPVLDHAGAISRSTAGQVVERSHRSLLGRWTQDYNFAKSNRQIAWLLAPRGLDWLLTQLRNQSAHTLFPEPAMRFAVTGSLAARQLLPPNTLSVTPLSLISLYTAEPLVLADRLRLRPATRATANVVLVQPRDDAVFASAELHDGHLRLAPRARVLADLLTQGGRFVDEAEQILEVLEQGSSSPLG